MFFVQYFALLSLLFLPNEYFIPLTVPLWLWFLEWSTKRMILLEKIYWHFSRLWITSWHNSQQKNYKHKYVDSFSPIPPFLSHFLAYLLTCLLSFLHSFHSLFFYLQNVSALTVILLILILCDLPLIHLIIPSFSTSPRSLHLLFCLSFHAFIFNNHLNYNLFVEFVIETFCQYLSRCIETVKPSRTLVSPLFIRVVIGILNMTAFDK